MWKVEDYSNGKSKGYLRITKDGKRVADVFPYATGQDVEWTLNAAQEIVDRMNEREARRCDEENMTPQEARAMRGALIDSSRLVEDLPDGPRDFAAVVGGLANFIENERMRAYNEGVDAERARCLKIAMEFKDNGNGVVSPQIADAIRCPGLVAQVG
jgi:hypothetical protein